MSSWIHEFVADQYSQLRAYLIRRANEDVKAWEILAAIFGTKGLIFVSKYLLFRWRAFWTSRKAAALKASRDAKHFTFGSVSKTLSKKLLKMDCGQLRKGLDEGAFTSVDLVNFYGHRCQTIGRKHELTTDELFDSAMVLAKKCDQERVEAKAQGKKLPFLHGIPFSVKDIIDLKGCHTTSGCAMLAGNKVNTTAPLLKPILDAGAIPIIRGNVPQASLGFHCFNYVWGISKNPLDTKRVCGGSSGGDAGLVTSRCVPIAIGADIGGSIRIPASFTGLVGFKPTQGRMLTVGMCAPRTIGFDLGFGHFKAAAGPLAHTVEDCIEFFKLLSLAKSEDLTPFQPSTSFNEEQYTSTHENRKGLKVGYIEEIPYLPVSPAVKRGMRMAKEALIKAGYEVVDFKVSEDEYAKGRDYVLGMVATGTASQMLKDMRRHGEDLTPGNWLYSLVIELGEVPRNIIRGLFKLFGNKRQARALKYLKNMKPSEYEVFMKGRYELADAIHQRWQEAGLTALITPDFPHCAFLARTADDYSMMLDYIFLWNALHYPAGSFPITKVRADEQTYEDSYNDNWTKALQKNAQDSYGMPVSVQVIGRAFQDEKVLAVMKALEEQVAQPLKSPK